MQQHELDAWLGDDHGLNDEQVRDLLWRADEIEARYPDPDDQDERTAALTVAHRLISGEQGVVEELAKSRAEAKAAEISALAGLREAALIRIGTTDTEAGFARAANVDRMAVRKWLGKRD